MFDDHMHGTHMYTNSGRTCKYSLSLRMPVVDHPTLARATVFTLHSPISWTCQGNHWGEVNPTRTSLNDVDLTYHRMAHTSDNGLGKMAGYQEQDPRTSFMSVFPVSDYKDLRLKPIPFFLSAMLTLPASTSTGMYPKENSQQAYPTPTVYVIAMVCTR